MDKKYLTVFLYTAAAGAILYVLDLVMAHVFIAISPNEWTLGMSRISMGISWVVSVLMILFIGLKLRKIYDRKDCLTAAALMMAYGAIWLVGERLILSSDWYGFYSIWTYLHFPMGVFSFVTQIVMQLVDLESHIWLYAVPSIFVPFVFLLFCKKDLSE